MKRRITIILLLLVVSAIVNIAVAWGCAYFYTPGTTIDDLMPKRDGEHAWIVSVPAHWPKLPDGVLDGSGQTWTIVRYYGNEHDHDEENDVLTTIESFIIDVWGHGWPMRSVRGQYWNEVVFDFQVKPTTSVQRYEGHPPESLWQLGIPISRGLYYLPVAPIWSGFIINTLFYAVLLWLLWFAPFAARRMIRHRRGQCEKCAYPVGTSSICTECGAAVVRKIVRKAEA